MSNYQLYKTNVLLGGLVCWDITINSNSTDTYIEDFHVMPINHDIPFNYLIDDYELNNSHLYNITKLYKDITGNFYNGHVKPILKSNYPIISENIFNTHNNIYEMGVERTDYKTYGKQYEFLCPVWLEKLDNDISFDFIVKNKENTEIINRTNLKLSETGKYKFHDKFIKYFKDYIYHVLLDKGNDNIIKIDLSNKTSYISGIDVKSGSFVAILNDSLINNILSRERPVMEVDSMIINSFKENNMINNQLFNFRFHFNIEDLIPIQLLKLIDWGQFTISMQVRINDEIIPLVDTFENYDFLSRKFCASKHNDSNMDKNLNVYDYLMDNKCMQLINKNKIYPSIIHWSLTDHNNYIFNTYGGFAGYSYDKSGNIIEHEHLYEDTPNIYLKNYSLGLNNIGWCNCIDINDSYLNSSLLWRVEQNAVNYLLLDELLGLPRIIYNELSDIFIDLDNPWIHNIKYSVQDINLNYKTPLHIATAHLHPKDDSAMETLVKKFETRFPNQNITSSYYTYYLENDDPNNIEKIYILYCRLGNPKMYNGEDNLNLMIFVSANLNLLTFAGFREFMYTNLGKINILDNPLSPLEIAKYEMKRKILDILNITDKAVDIPIIQYNTSLMAIKAPSPSLMSTEINYYKNNSALKYLFRYDGKIKPTFLSEIESLKKNLFFYKEILNHDLLLKNPNYTTFEPLKYPPIYPSIGYYPIKYQHPNYIKPYEYIKLNDLEYKWFNSNVIFITPDTFEIEFSINKESGQYINYDEFHDNLYKNIKKIYNLTDPLIEFIKNKYLYEVLNDYLMNTAIKTKIVKHIYKVKLNLI